ncbi:hypothetical protein V6N13_023990 [Hibiscus sabdariffa]
MKPSTLKLQDETPQKTCFRKTYCNTNISNMQSAAPELYGHYRYDCDTQLWKHRKSHIDCESLDVDSVSIDDSHVLVSPISNVHGLKMLV